MPFRLLCCAVWVAISGGCGWFGIDLLYPDSGQAPDDSGSLRDADVVRDADSMLDAEVMQDADAVRDADTGSDASTPSDAGAEAGVPRPQDAGSKAPADAGTDSAQAAACGGDVVFDLCWYLGAANTSCDETCASHGGFDSRTASFVGTPNQGGSRTECAELLSALGYPGNVGEGLRDDGNGFGCHLWSGDRWWLRTPNFSSDVKAPDARVVCACRQ